MVGTCEIQLQKGSLGWKEKDKLLIVVQEQNKFKILKMNYMQDNERRISSGKIQVINIFPAGSVKYEI